MHSGRARAPAHPENAASAKRTPLGAGLQVDLRPSSTALHLEPVQPGMWTEEEHHADNAAVV
jgi:hypothetical protein